MKRVFDEISDDEWSNHSFKPSRVLKPSQTPPPIESFAFGSTSNPAGSDSDSDCVEITGTFENKLDNKLEDDLEDDDFGEALPVTNRSRRFVVDDDDDEEEEDIDRGGLAEVIEVKSNEEDDWSDLGLDGEELREDDGEELREDDVVGQALQKCGKISVELRRELYGSSAAACDRYAEVENSSVRIVTQVNI